MPNFIQASINQKQFLVPIEDVQEILPMLALKSPDFQKPGEQDKRFRGLFNLRGEIIPVFSWDSDDKAPHPDQFILVSRSHNPASQTGNSVMGLVVDDVVDLNDLPASQIVRRRLSPTSTETFARIEDRMLSVVHPNEVFDQP